MTDKKLLRLLDKLKTNTLSDKEYEELMAWIQTEVGEKALWKLWDGDFEELSIDTPLLNREKVFERLHDRITFVEKNEAPKLKKIRKAIQTAAAFLLFLSVSIWLYQTYNQQAVTQLSDNSEQISPGENRAVLVLEDGKRIELSSESAMGLRETFDQDFFIDGEGTLSYAHTEVDMAGSIGYNTIITPKGGEYKVILSDGTAVWLNAGSKLKYPVRFVGKERLVELQGEAYFEVTHAADKPFKVYTGNQKLEVLGTSFNVKNYDGQVTTTLVEGSVALEHAGTTGITILKPSQQAIYQDGNEKLSVRTVDTFYDTAWIHGNFAFYKTSIYQVMAEVSRWYDVEIAYEADLSKKYFSGTVSRFENINELLKTIELTGSVKFKLEGRRVRVME